ncbi:unnamed protein product [Fusarium equiseti]|uniref:Uncharacterized protein n=1 Tax=Fusarium equiseti TaxID=61235 RepID=A0A8J2J5N5_FUSEQ|nr:unnamed protein product [Fusarium equiseti]
MGYNCSCAARGDQVEPYGDVAGPGREQVIVGFLGTGWLAVAFVLLHYLFVFDPYEDPFQAGDGNNSSAASNPWRANPIDCLVKGIVKKGLDRMHIGSDWISGLEMSILGMCDLQFVTGLGIFISGFIDLTKGISAYHFILVTHLAWFSNLTHICGLTVLRKYFHTRPTERIIRMVCMVILALMLLVAIGPTLSFNWAHLDEGTASLAGTDAICFYDPARSTDWHKRSEHVRGDFTGSTAYQTGTMSIVLLILSFVYWLVVSAAWGATKLFMTKSSVTVEENGWTFGQIFPAFLLIGPIATPVKGAFGGQFSSPPSIITDPTTPAEQTASEDHATIFHDAQHFDESLEMRRFRQYLFNCLGRNYYDTSTCPWIVTVFCFACIQVLEVTVLTFLELVVQRSSATNALSTVSILIFVVTPTAIYFLFFACLYFEYFFNGRHCMVFSILVSVVVFGLDSLHPVWGVLYNPSSTELKVMSRKGQFDFTWSISAFIFVLAIAGFTQPSLVFGRNPN